MPDNSDGSTTKTARTEVIQLHCTPDEKAMIEREAALRAGGNVDVLMLSVFKFFLSEVKKRT